MHATSRPRRRRLAYAFSLLAVALPAAWLTSCSEATSVTTGTCTRPDGTIVRRRVYEETCANICPDCRWTQEGSN